METTTTFHPCLVLSCLGLWLFRFVPGAEGLDLWKAARYFGERMRWRKGRNRAVWEVGGWIFISLVVVAKCGVLLVVHARERTIEGNTE